MHMPIHIRSHMHMHTRIHTYNHIIRAAIIHHNGSPAAYLTHEIVSGHCRRQDRCGSIYK
jgi:hypothetical protein